MRMFSSKQFWLKFFEIFCLLLVVIGLMQLFNSASRWQFQFVTQTPKLLMTIGAMLFISFIIAWLSQRSGKGEGAHRWLIGIITFYVAYEISVYGFSKILQTQFQPPNYVLEQPIGELSGFWLTWTYFGHSQTMAFILGATQILGSILLLFRKTRLIGVFILLPVMVNINLVNHFYDISPLAYYNAIHYTFILVFLMMLDYDLLKAAFLSYKEKVSFSWKVVLLNIVRVAVVAGAFFYIVQLKKGIEPKTKINGEWKVQSIARNNQTIEPTQWQDSVWTKLYFEWRYGCIFKYHPDKFQDKDLGGQYKVDEKKQTIAINFYPQGNVPADSALLHYQFTSDSTMHLYGNCIKDSVAMNLKRIK
jgi:hypothetical protein